MAASLGSLRPLVVLALATGCALGQASPPCPAAGEPMHWRVDYCMLRMETDDEIAVSGCIEKEGRQRFRDACASNTHFKKRMCQRMIRQGTREGTLEQCVNDPAFRGRTVRNEGVGG